MQSIQSIAEKLQRLHPNLYQRGIEQSTNSDCSMIGFKVRYHLLKDGGNRLVEKSSYSFPITNSMIPSKVAKISPFDNPHRKESINFLDHLATHGRYEIDHSKSSTCCNPYIDVFLALPKQRDSSQN